MKRIILLLKCVLFIITIFNSCSIAKNNKSLINNERIMWGIASDNNFNTDKIIHEIDSVYAKTFDTKVKYRIIEVDCCYKEEKTMSIRTFVINKGENIIFYFDDKLQIIDTVHELPPLQGSISD